MKTLQEIFKDKPQLLESKEVKEVAEHFNIQYGKLAKKHNEYRMKIENIALNSEFYKPNGTSIADAIREIFEL